MKETVLDVLMYLFETFVDGDSEPEPDRNELREELVRAGFGDREIDRALEWLDGLNPGIRFHDLRHFFASVMIDRGVSSVVLADVMGHRDSRTTERIYVHLFNRRRTADQVRNAMQSAMSQRPRP